MGYERIAGYERITGHEGMRMVEGPPGQGGIISLHLVENSLYASRLAAEFPFHPDYFRLVGESWLKLEAGHG